MAGRLKPKSEIYGQGSDVHTEWGMDNVIKEYDGLLSKTYAEQNVWRAVGLVSILFFLLSLGIAFYCVTRPREDLVVISVDDVGNSRYLGSVRGKSFDDYGYTEKVLKKIVKDFIVNTYTVSTDSEIMYENYRKCLFFLDKNRREAFINMVNTDDPFSNVGKFKKNAQVDTCIPLTQNSYQVEWYVITSELNGSRSERVHYRGIFSFTKIPTSQYSRLTDEELDYNPSGYYITDYNIEKIRIEEFR